MSIFLFTLAALAVMMAGLGAGMLAGRRRAPQRGCGKDCSCLSPERRARHTAFEGGER